MSCAGLKNIDLVLYLFGELTASRRKMMASLLQYYPEADPADWGLVDAGQRVCIMKPVTPGKLCSGFLQFGTEVVATEDGSMTGLLGASPGASTTVTITLGILNKCFKENMAEWTPKILEMVPSYNPNDGGYDTDKAVKGKTRTAKALGLNQ